MRNTPFKVSIITVVFNSEKTISQCINSVLEQDYNQVEYIIIDGKSTDQTTKIIDTFSNRIDKYVSEKDGGIYEALNKGFKMATGDLIGILHSDDVFASNQVVSKIVERFNGQHLDAVYGDLVYVNKDNTEQVIRYWKAGDYRDGLFLYGWMPPHPTFFARKNVYEKYGYFNTLLECAADYELLLRLIHKHKIKIHYLPEVLTKMRIGGQSNASFNNRIKAYSEDKKAWKLNQLKPHVFTGILKPLRKVLQFRKKSP